LSLDLDSVNFTAVIPLPAFFPLRAVTVFATASLLFFQEAVIATSEWPEFRGAGRQGHADAANVPLKWSDTTNVMWKSEVEGIGWSSPVVADSRIFLTSAVQKGTGLSLRALAFDARDGSLLWDTEVFAAKAGKIHKRNSHASATPVFKNGRLYVHFGHDGTACLDAANGSIQWTQTELRYSPVHGNGGSPIMVGEKLIYSCDGAKNPFVVALNKDTGKVIWKTARNVEVSRTFSFSTPLAIEIAGKTQVISPGSGAVIAYDPDDGSEIWRVGYDQGYSVVPRPVYDESLSMIYVCTGFGRAKLLGIKVDAASRGDVTKTHLKWEQAKAIPKESSPILVDGLLYLNDDKGVASCFDAKTGEVQWQERIESGSYSTSPTYAGGHIFFQNDAGLTTVIDPGPDLQIVGENDLGEKAMASFAVIDGSIFIRTEGHLWRIGQ